MPRVEGILLGSDSMAPCEVALRRIGDQYHYSHSCTGDFVISNDGSEITWYSERQRDFPTVWNDITGRVMAVALHAEGHLCLHGSGVAIGDRAVAFLAAKGTGKSTIAAAIVDAGAQLASDDTLAVLPFQSPQLLPGLHQLRLRSDSAACAMKGASSAAIGTDGKHVVAQIAQQKLLHRTVKLDAIYVLVPSSSRDASSARRERLQPTRAAMALVQHAKIGVLLGGTEATVVLGRAAQIADAVPVFALNVARDLGRLSDAVSTIMDWHQASGSETTQVAAS